MIRLQLLLLFFFFFTDTATTEIYTLSLHDALPISQRRSQFREFSFLPCALFLQLLEPCGLGREQFVRRLLFGRKLLEPLIRRHPGRTGSALGSNPQAIGLEPDCEYDACRECGLCKRISDDSAQNRGRCGSPYRHVPIENGSLGCPHTCEQFLQSRFLVRASLRQPISVSVRDCGNSLCRQ